MARKMSPSPLISSERRALLTESPVPLGNQWVKYVNQPQTEAELLALRQCVTRGRPFGNEAWCKRVTKKMGLEHTYRSRGRPRKKPSSDEG
jgi:putative transposase